ncbi:DUF5702 domain-containing protein [Abyssisolibacter fermentans]|uniref:DUF5702 domain-containing protein n=1 Tax=Abyssisolibacter fermentans TaxID=1766203 RepID=UPI00082E1CCE|nr:DUF5702 domain-containing protein [Abyssisolibacter fermentans]
MFLYRQKGAISIFLCIILLVVMTLTGLMVDNARIRVANTQAQRATLVSINSALAGYNEDLKNDWGLFALSQNDKAELEEVLLYYFNKNLMIDKDDLTARGAIDFLDLYDYKVENIEIEPLFKITDVDVAKKQIIEYMKYRAPKELVEEYLLKLEVLKKASSTTESYSEKLDVEKTINELDKLRKKLYKLVGPVAPFDNKSIQIYKDEFDKNICFINRFNNEDDFSDGQLSFQSKVIKYRDTIIEYQNNRIEIRLLQKEIEEINDEIEEINKKIRNLDNDDPEDKKKIDDYKSDRTSLRDEKSDLEAKIDTLRDVVDENKKTIDKLYSDFQNDLDRDNIIIKYFDEPNGYNKACAMSIEIIDEVSRQTIKVTKRIDEFENHLDQKKDKIISSSYEELEKDISEYRSLLPDENSLAYNNNKFKNTLNDNLEFLKEMMEHINEISPSVIENSETIVNDEYSYKFSKIEDFKNIIGNSSNKKGLFGLIPKFNNNIETNVKLSAKQDEESEKRAEEGEEELEEIADEANEEIEEDDDTKKYIEIPKDLYETLPSYESKYSDEETRDVVFDVDEEDTYSEDAFDFLSGFGFDLLGDMRDKIYVNEYIVNSFKNDVSELKPMELNLRNIKKSELETYFNNGEVEYILNGCRSERKNKLLTDSKIIMIRFGLNCIHVFTDSQKRAEATAIATAMAGWWTAGAGIPIFRTILQCAWAMAESILDLRCLERGEPVPMLKTKATWKADCGKLIAHEIIDYAEGEAVRFSEQMTNYCVDVANDYMDKFIEEKIAAIEGSEPIGNGSLQDFANVSDPNLKELISGVDAKLEQVNQEAKGKAKEELEKYMQKSKASIQEYINSHKVEFNKIFKEKANELSKMGKDKLDTYIDKYEKDNKLSKLDLKKDSKAIAIDTYYIDYLRFLLLLQNEEKSINRALDLIQINYNKNDEAFRLSEHKVCLKVKATISVKCLFMTQIFLPKDKKMKDNRYRFTVELYNWY